MIFIISGKKQQRKQQKTPKLLKKVERNPWDHDHNSCGTI